MFSSTPSNFLPYSRFDMFDPSSDTNQINEFPDNPSLHNPTVQDQPPVPMGSAGYYLEEPSFEDAFLSQSNHPFVSNPASVANHVNYNNTNYVNAGQSYYQQPVTEAQYDGYSSQASSTPANNASSASNNLTSISTNTTGQYTPQYADASMLFFDQMGYAQANASNTPNHSNTIAASTNNNSGNYYSSPQVPQYGGVAPVFDLAQPQQINYQYSSNAYDHASTAKSTPSLHSPHKYIKDEYEGQSQLSALDMAAASHAEKPRHRRYRVIRGISAGGCTTKPPKESVDSNSKFYPVELQINGASVEDVCYSQWNRLEKGDRRRIVRIERIQQGNKLIANFSIVGSADENPVTLPPPRNVDVVEVSCLECDIVMNDEYDSSSDDENKGTRSPKNYVKQEADGGCYQYYITSVEVVEIVELLIGTELVDPAERRRERGRVRSNLVPFWSKKPISSRMSDSSSTSSSNSNTPNHFNAHPTNQYFRVELAKRIMGYEIRKPRGFDKEVRILRWDKLVPALKRALQSYYTEIPN